MPPMDFITHFWLALRLLDYFELIWEQPISDGEAITIYLFAYPHHILCHFMRSQLFHLIQSISFDDAIGIIQCSTAFDQSHDNHCINSLPAAVPSLPLIANRAYIHKDVHLCESYTLYGPWRPNKQHDLWIGGLLALFAPALPNPVSYNPTWDEANIDPTVHDIIYWLNRPTCKQSPVILMHHHFTWYVTRNLAILKNEVNLLPKKLACKKIYDAYKPSWCQGKIKSTILVQKTIDVPNIKNTPDFILPKTKSKKHARQVLQH